MNTNMYTQGTRGAVPGGSARPPLEEGAVYEWSGTLHRITLAFRSPTQRERRTVREADCHLALVAHPNGVILLIRFIGLDWTAAICPASAPPEGAPHRLEVVLRDALSGATVVTRQLALPQTFHEQLGRALSAQPASVDRRSLLRQLSSLRARYGPDRELLALATWRCLAEELPVAVPSRTASVMPDLPNSIARGDRDNAPSAEAAPVEEVHQPRVGVEPASAVLEAADDYISIPRAAALAGLAPATLRSQATRRKRSLRTIRVGDRGVVTTRRWLHEYLAKRDPRGSRQPLPASYTPP